MVWFAGYAHGVIRDGAPDGESVSKTKGDEKHEKAAGIFISNGFGMHASE